MASCATMKRPTFSQQRVRTSKGAAASAVPFSFRKKIEPIWSAAQAAAIAAARASPTPA